MRKVNGTEIIADTLRKIKGGISSGPADFLFFNFVFIKLNNSASEKGNKYKLLLIILLLE